MVSPSTQAVGEDSLREVFVLMLEELDNTGLEVELIPFNDYECAMRGGCIRVAVSHNVDWYRNLCATFQSGRRRRRMDDNDTRIKRQSIRRILKRLSLELPTTSMYTEHLVDIAKERREEWK